MSAFRPNFLAKRVSGHHRFPTLSRVIDVGGAAESALFLDEAWLAVAIPGRSVSVPSWRGHYLIGRPSRYGEVRDSVALVNLPSGRVVDQIDVDAGPVHVARHPTRPELAVSCAEAGVVDFLE